MPPRTQHACTAMHGPMPTPPPHPPHVPMPQKKGTETMRADQRRRNGPPSRCRLIQQAHRATPIRAVTSAHALTTRAHTHTRVHHGTTATCVLHVLPRKRSGRVPHEPRQRLVLRHYSLYSPAGTWRQVVPRDDCMPRERLPHHTHTHPHVNSTYTHDKSAPTQHTPSRPPPLRRIRPPAPPNRGRAAAAPRGAPPARHPQMTASSAPPRHPPPPPPPPPPAPTPRARAPSPAAARARCGSCRPPQPPGRASAPTSSPCPCPAPPGTPGACHLHHAPPVTSVPQSGPT